MERILELHAELRRLNRESLALQARRDEISRELVTLSMASVDWDGFGERHGVDAEFISKMRDVLQDEKIIRQNLSILLGPLESTSSAGMVAAYDL